MLILSFEPMTNVTNIIPICTRQQPNYSATHKCEDDMCINLCDISNAWKLALHACYIIPYWSKQISLILFLLRGITFVFPISVSINITDIQAFKQDGVCIFSPQSLEPIWVSHVGNHDDVIKWKQFPRYWPFVRGIHRFTVNSPHKGQWRGALMFTLICVWINGCVNNRESGDLRRYCAHYGVTIMITWSLRRFLCSGKVT